jgi:hypothetical protein
MPSFAGFHGLNLSASMPQASGRNIDYWARVHKTLRVNLTNCCQGRAETVADRLGVVNPTGWLR